MNKKDNEIPMNETESDIEKLKRSAPLILFGALHLLIVILVFRVGEEFEMQYSHSLRVIVQHVALVMNIVYIISVIRHLRKYYFNF